MKIWARICASYVSWKLYVKSNDYNLDLNLKFLILSVFEMSEYFYTELCFSIGCC